MIAWSHVDVFASGPFTGNTLAVVPEAGGLSEAQMGAVTRELRHFETIFLMAIDGHDVSARVFDLFGELPFAGHPVLGAASVLHDRYGEAARETWRFALPARSVSVTTERRSSGAFSAVVNQGLPNHLGEVPRARAAEIASWFSLDADDVSDALPIEVVSTGLAYLLVPVRSAALARARICVPDLAEKQAALGADFTYLFDPVANEGRTWNNDGVIEDVATGSAAGCVAAWLHRHGRLEGEAMLRQGRFTGRPSLLRIGVRTEGGRLFSVTVGGDCVVLGEGRFFMAP